MLKDQPGAFLSEDELDQWDRIVGDRLSQRRRQDPELELPELQAAFLAVVEARHFPDEVTHFLKSMCVTVIRQKTPAEAEAFKPWLETTHEDFWAQALQQTTLSLRDLLLKVDVPRHIAELYVVGEIGQIFPGSRRCQYTMCGNGDWDGICC